MHVCMCARITPGQPGVGVMTTDPTTPPLAGGLSVTLTSGRTNLSSPCSLEQREVPSEHMPEMGGIGATSGRDARARTARTASRTWTMIGRGWASARRIIEGLAGALQLQSLQSLQSRGGMNKELSRGIELSRGGMKKKSIAAYHTQQGSGGEGREEGREKREERKREDRRERREKRVYEHIVSIAKHDTGKPVT